MRRFSILPHKISYGIALVLAFVAEALFMLFLIALDILPLAYLLGVIGVLVLIDLLILLLFNGKKKRDVKSLGALVIIVFMLNILLVGDYFIYSTYDTLEQISSLHDRWEYYEVIAPVDSKYQKVADIKGSEINVVDMQSKQLQEAEERLVTKGDVTYTKCDKLLDVGHKLVDKKGKVHDRLALVSKSENKLLGRNIEGYKDQTQVIYRLKVKQRADDHSKSVDVTKDSFNVLISGIDSWGTIDEGGLSDVNMVMTVNPTTREVMLTSIPRDSYVPLHSYGEKDKLTHTGIYGEEETKQTIEDLLDIDINY